MEKFILVHNIIYFYKIYFDKLLFEKDLRFINGIKIKGKKM